MANTPHGPGGGSLGRRNVIRAGVTAAWATPLVLVSVPAQAAVCSPAGPALVLTALNASIPGIPEGDVVSYQPLLRLTNNGPGPVTVLQATAGPSAGNFMASMDIEDEDADLWGQVEAGNETTTTLTLAAPAPQDVIAAGTSRDYTFILELLGAAPAAGDHPRVHGGRLQLGRPHAVLPGQRTRGVMASVRPQTR